LNEVKSDLALEVDNLPFVDLCRQMQIVGGANEILKYKYGLNKQAPNLHILKKMVKQAVHIYNNERVH